MRKHRLAAIVAAITMGLASLASCNKPDEPVEKEVPVAGITLSQTSVELVEGGSVSISATVTPSNATDKTVTWSSSAADVVSVSEGTITAIKPGTAVITAKAGGKSATCNVTVLKKTVAVESVSLDKTELTLVEGESASLTAAVLPENATDRSVSWKSSDEVVATVDAQGKVSALKAGTSTITVTTTDGGKTAQCVVEIKAKYIAVTGIALDKESATLQVGESLMLTASVSPDNATEPEVTWTVSDSGILQNDGNGSFKALSVGEAVVTAKAGDKTAECKVTVAATPVTGVSVSPETLDLVTGAQQQLSAKVTPANATDKSLKWESSKPSVATVSEDGLVKARGTGIAQIVVSTVDGNFKAICLVNVVSPIDKFEVDGLCFKAVSSGSTDVKLTNNVYDYWPHQKPEYKPYKGHVVVPASVTFEGVEYKVTTIGRDAFCKCPDLLSVTVPEGITDLEVDAVNDCAKIEVLRLPSTTRGWASGSSSNAVSQCPLLRIEISGTSFSLVDDCLYDDSQHQLTWVPDWKETVVVKDGCGTIRTTVLNAKQVRKVVIPSSVSAVNAHNFQECGNLVEVDLDWDYDQLDNLIYEGRREGGHPEYFYFYGRVYSEITIKVPSGMKDYYSNHKLWGMGFNIVEK